MEGVLLRFIATIILGVFMLVGLSVVASAQAAPTSERMAATVMTVWKDAVTSDPTKPEKWNYEQGVLLKGIEGVWLRTGDGR